VKSETLEKQRIAYIKAKKKIDRESLNIECHIEVKTYLKNNKIKCVKYHYALEKEVQKSSSNNAYIEFTDNCQYLAIVNRKEVEKSKYVLEADPDFVRQ
jgi:hypothetical protein